MILNPKRVMIPQVRIIASGLRPAAASLLRFSARAMTSAPATPSSSSIGQTDDNNNPTFASLMRNCKLTSMGNPVGQVVVGKVYHIVDDDLYIDFGHKFGCICKKPRDDRGKYVRGTEVKLKIKSLELSQRFLGYDQDISLMEADALLLGLNK